MAHPDSSEQVMGVPAAMAVAPAPRRLAIAYSRQPLPMRRADQMTVAHLVAFLAARGHAIDLYVLDTGEAITPAQRDWLAARCRTARTFRHGPVRGILGVLRGLLRGHPLQVGWFHNAAQFAAVRRGINEVDLGYCYYIRSAEAMRGLTSHAATFLAMQLSQTLNTRRMAAHFRNLRERLIYAVESRLLPGYEARIWQDFTRTVLIGPRDLEEIRGICRQNGVAEIDNVVFGPHGVDVDRFAPRDGVAVEPYSLVFNGVLRTYTNVHAIIWFADHVWPLVLEAEARATLTIVGREPRPELRALAVRPGITVTGEVPDPADYICRAAICIDPVQAGAGMQNKLVELTAAAKPVVATTPGEFAKAVLDLLGDEGRRRALGEAARAFATERWSWEGRFLELEAEMIRAVDEKAKGGPA